MSSATWRTRSGDLDLGVLLHLLRAGLWADGLDVWSHRIRHYVGAYLAQLGGLDALVFTAGIGENSPEGAVVRVLVVPTNEELAIARAAAARAARD